MAIYPTFVWRCSRSCFDVLEVRRSLMIALLSISAPVVDAGTCECSIEARIEQPMLNFTAVEVLQVESRFVNNVVLKSVTMAAMAISAPVGGMTRFSASSQIPALKGQRLNVKVDFVRRAPKAGGLEVVMTATLPPKFK